MRSGLKAIKEFWSQFMESANAQSAQLESVQVVLAGDSAVESGRTTITLQSDGRDAAAVAMKYVVHWRQTAGLCKWQTDIWNMASKSGPPAICFSSSLAALICLSIR